MSCTARRPRCPIGSPRAPAPTLGQRRPPFGGGHPAAGGGDRELECVLHDSPTGATTAVVVGHVVAVGRKLPRTHDPPVLTRAPTGASATAATTGRSPSRSEVALPSRDGPLRMLSLSRRPRSTQRRGVRRSAWPARRARLPTSALPLGDALGEHRLRSRTANRVQARMRSEGVGVTGLPPATAHWAGRLRLRRRHGPSPGCSYEALDRARPGRSGAGPARRAPRGALPPTAAGGPRRRPDRASWSNPRAPCSARERRPDRQEDPKVPVKLHWFCHQRGTRARI